MIENYAQVHMPSFMDRLRLRLFPYPPRPVNEADERSYLTTEVHVHVDWLDWLRLLWSGHALIRVTTYTDCIVHSASSVSSVGVLSKRFVKPSASSVIPEEPTKPDKEK